MQTQLNFFTFLKGERKGPYSVTEIREALRLGNIGMETLVWCEGNQEWQPLRTVAVLLCDEPSDLGKSQPQPPSPSRTNLQAEVSKKESLCQQFPNRRANVFMLLSAAMTTFVIGLFAPMMTMTKFVLWQNRVSLAGGLSSLLEEGAWGLFFVIFVFSVAFPVLKLLWLFKIWFGKHSGYNDLHHQLHWLAVLGKWSMLDVFVVALVVVTVKLGILANVRVEYGAYIFAASVVLTKLAVIVISRVASNAQN